MNFKIFAELIELKAKTASGLSMFCWAFRTRFIQLPFTEFY